MPCLFVQVGLPSGPQAQGGSVHTPRFRLTAATALMAAAAMSLAACGGSGADSKAASATSAADLGGMDKLIEAAKAEGNLHVITLPRDWANYGAIMDAFTKK